MYRAFNLDCLPSKDNLFQQYHAEGLSFYTTYKKEVNKTLKSFIDERGIMQGSKMQENWFSQNIPAHVFISHSGKNKDIAIFIAGFLWTNFRIASFVDSCVWGNYKDLLEMIDYKYCFNPHTNLFDYEMTNYSASHVNMMLSTALSMMMDKTECVIFLNTPDSISATNVLNKTYSPWIYSELSMTKVLRPNIPKRYQVTEKYSNFSGPNEDLEKAKIKIEYDVDLSHLAKITIDTLNAWANLSSLKHKPLAALDILYSSFPAPKKSNLIHG